MVHFERVFGSEWIVDKFSCLIGAGQPRSARWATCSNRHWL